MESHSNNPDTRPLPTDEPEPTSSFGDIVAGVAFIVFAALMFVGALNFPYRARMGLITSSAFTPMLLTGVVVVLSGILIFNTCRKATSISPRAWFAKVAGEDTTRRALVIIAMTAVYVLLVGTIHFLAANVLYLLAIFWYLKIATPIRIVVYAVVNGVLISLAIPYIFQLPLP